MGSFKCLVRLQDLKNPCYLSFIRELNKLATNGVGLLEYNTYSRIFEYPWLWFHLNQLKGQALKVLDVGSERSPFPWFLATQGFNVIVSDVTPQYWRIWQKSSKKLDVNVGKLILDAQNIDLHTASIDIYLSVSVIEHIPDKAKAIAEAARVLRPGGMIAMTFDICEPAMGMSFPETNGKALTMQEFDDLFRNSPYFEPGIAEIPWNIDDIPDYLAWHRTTAPWHNYVTGLAIIQRNNQPWIKPNWKDNLRTLRGNIRVFSSLISYRFKAIRHKATRIIKRPIRKGLGWITSTHPVLILGEFFFSFMNMRTAGRKINFSKIKHVLVMRMDGIGDVVMNTPFLRELRRNLPDTWITLIVRPVNFNLVELCPYVNEVLTYDFNDIRNTWRLLRYWKGLAQAFVHFRRLGRLLKLAQKYLWHRRFDLAIIPRWDVDYYYAAFVAYFSGAPWRAGYSENVTDHKQQNNRGYNQLLSHVLDDNTPKHEVEHNLDIIRFMGGNVQEQHLELWFSSEDEEYARSVLESHGVHSDDLLVAFGIGAGEPKRIWHLSRFIELGNLLKEEYNARLLVVGGKEEKSLGQEMQQQLGNAIINVAGQTTLRKTVTLLKNCTMYVGCDTGSMHIAAAVGIPVVEICCHPLDGSQLHVNSPNRFRPWGVSHLVLQPEKALPPCSNACNASEAHCILGVTVNQVKEAIIHLLKTA